MKKAGKLLLSFSMVCFFSAIFVSVAVSMISGTSSANFEYLLPIIAACTVLAIFGVLLNLFGKKESEKNDKNEYQSKHYIKNNKSHNIKAALEPAAVTWVLCVITNAIKYPQDISNIWSFVGFMTLSTTTFAVLTVIGYLIYRFGISKNKDDKRKLWFSFIIIYAFIIITTVIEAFQLNV